MKFGPVSVEQSPGCVLAHGLVLNGRRLKKGQIISATDRDEMFEVGLSQVIVAQLEATDVLEDDAAQALSDALISEGLRQATPFTGRVNIFAQSAGIFNASREAVDAINGVSENITLACLEDGVFVEAGRMVATVKIIPFAVSEAELQVAIQFAQKTKAFSLAVAQPLRVGLLATQLPSLKSSVMDKTLSVLNARLQPAGSAVVREFRVEHTAVAVADGLRQLEPQCDLLVVFGASAITDREDVIPSGVVEAGGRIERMGMPVDPGNLLLTASLNGKPVIGAPGCARSPAENGFDWVLYRLLCGLTVDAAFIKTRGVGGLLMEIVDRPQPRDPS